MATPMVSDYDFQGIITYSGASLPDYGDNLMKLDASSNIVIGDSMFANRMVTLEIDTADVLQLNTTPQTILGAIASYIIVPNWVMGEMNYNSATYATNTTLQVYIDTMDNVMFTIDSILPATAGTTIGRFGAANAVAETTQFTQNKALKVNVAGGNPTTGDSDLFIYANLQIINAGAFA